MEPLSFVQDSILHLIQDNYNRAHDSATTLDDKTQQNIGISTLVIGLTAAAYLGQSQLSDERKVIFAFLFVTYFASFLFSYRAFVPRRRVKGSPLRADWDEFLRVSAKTQTDYYDWLVATYLEAIEDYTRVAKWKGRFLRTSMFLVGVQVLLVLSALILTH